MQIVRYTWVSLCVLCVVCCCGARGCGCGGGGGRGGGGRGGGEGERLIEPSGPAKVSLKIAETEQPYQIKRMIGGIGDMLFSIYSQT